MSIVIEVRSTAVHSRSLTSKSGKPLQFHEQEAWAWLVDREGNQQPFPTQTRLNVPAADKPYGQGRYTLAPASFYTDQYGALKLSPRLIPLAK